MSFYLQALIGGLVWLVANVVYVDLKRKGIRGFTRFAAFWTGTPTTWISLFAVREGSQPVFDPPPDDEGEALLSEIRRDRRLRPGDDEDADPAGAGENADERHAGSDDDPLDDSEQTLAF